MYVCNPRTLKAEAGDDCLKPVPIKCTVFALVKDPGLVPSTHIETHKLEFQFQWYTNISMQVEHSHSYYA